MDDDNLDNISEEEQQKQAQEQKDIQTNEKALKVAAKGVANYFTAGQGGAVVDAAANTRLGKAVLNGGSKIVTKINKATPMGRMAQNALNTANDTKALDVADKGMDMMSAAGAAKGAAGAAGAAGTGAKASEASGAAKESTDLAPKSGLPDKHNNELEKKPNGKKQLDFQNNESNNNESNNNESNDSSNQSSSDDNESDNEKEEKKEKIKKKIKRRLTIKIISAFGGFFAFVFVIILIIAIAPNAGATLDLTSGKGAAENAANASSSSGTPYTNEEIESALIYMGDSRTHGMSNAFNNSNIGFICEDGKGYSWLLSTALSQLDTMAKDGKKKFVVMAFGVNDLGNIDKYINEYNSMISKYSSLKFFFMSVNPVDETTEASHGYSVTNASIEAFNSKLSSTYGAQYIDVYSQIKGGIATVDGLHYTTDVYKNIHSIVLKYIQSKTSKSGGGEAVTFLSMYPLDGSGTNLLQNKSLSSAIGDDGVQALSASVASSVEKAGKCTGNAVASAGIALVYGLAQKGYRLPYYWGGGHGGAVTGVSGSWGSATSKSCSSTTCYSSSGLDCSGFVSWAISNAGVPIVTDTYGFLKVGTKETFSAAKAGDLLCSTGHVILILENKGDYLITAESTGGTNGAIFRHYTPSAASGYNILDMSSYYSSHCKS